MQHSGKWNTTSQILKPKNIKLRDINGLTSSQIKKMSVRCRSQDGTWRLLPDELMGLTTTPPVNSADDFTLTITSYASEGENESVATSTETIGVTVHAVADTSNLSVVDAVGLEDTAITLNIQPALTTAMAAKRSI